MKLPILILAIVNQIGAQQCPKFSCETKMTKWYWPQEEIVQERYELIHQEMKSLDKSGTICFKHSADDPVTQINIQECQDPDELCMLERGEYSWVKSSFQFTPLAQRKNSKNKNQSQIFGKINQKTCINKEDSITDRLNGRKCDNAFQCVSSQCDEETSACRGRTHGMSCSNHIECDNGLACRPSTKWPFPTLCLSLADVASECLSEYDCKPRNFCWKIKQEAKNKVCLEKNSAPDGIQIVWDIELYPEVNTESIYAHGIYCQSGLVFKNGKMAECVSINGVGVTNLESTPTLNDKNRIGRVQKKEIDRLAKGYKWSIGDEPNGECTPDGKTFCHYAKNNEVKFSLPCECGLYQKEFDGQDKDMGFCPIPDSGIIKNANNWIRLMNIQDNCHTLDRANFYAQMECGIALNLNILQNATTAYYNQMYYPYIQNGNVSECMKSFIPDTWTNIQSGALKLGMVISTTIIYISYV